MNVHFLSLTVCHSHPCYSSLVGERAAAVSMSVCLREHISETTRPNFNTFPAHVVYGRGSIALWQWCNISGFVDDVMLSYNGPHVGVSLRQHCSSLAVMSRTTCHLWCVVLAALCPRRRQAPRLDESFVRGVPGRNMRCTIGLVTIVFENAAGLQL